MDLTADADAGEVATRFAIGGAPTRITRLPGGHINDSFRIRAPAGEFLLQRLNPHVFPRADLVMENVARVSRHLAARSRGGPWRALELVKTQQGSDWWTDAAASRWRMFPYLGGTTTRERADTSAMAREAARAFGAFVRLLADCPARSLHQTIPGFHDTARRLAALEDAARRDPRGRAAGARADVQAVLDERAIADVLPPLVARGEIPVRVVHNDAKIANVLFDVRTGAASCVIDLDTVMPGLALHDFGDMVRSMASSTDEDEPDAARIEARPEFIAALAEGFLAEAADILTPTECRLLVFAGRLITLEQAARFLSDHLEGDRYYRTARAGHNLDRARAQVALYRSLTIQESALAALVARLAP